jgi:hypothetical protein
LTEFEVDGFALRRLSTGALDGCLGHLLWCKGCQDKVNEELEFAQASREAALLLANDSSFRSRRWPKWLDSAIKRWSGWLNWPSGYRWMPVAMAACLAIGFAILRPMASPRGEVEVALRSERGTPPAAIHGAAGARVRLRIDVRDVVTAPRYRVALVNENGAQLESAVVAPKEGELVERLQHALPAGSYWVRLSLEDGQLLREYPLRAE